MAITVTLAPEVEAYVRSEVAGGTAIDEAELVSQALNLFREMKERHTDLRQQVQESLASADRGEIEELDIESVKSRLRDEFSTGTSD